MFTKRRPVSVGEMLTTESLEPMSIAQDALAEAMGIPRKYVNQLCNNWPAITADTVLILARVFGNSADFWLNLQRHNDRWEALNDAERRKRIECAHPVAASAATFGMVSRRDVRLDRRQMAASMVSRRP